MGKIFVGSLSYDATVDDLEYFFKQGGFEPHNCKVIVDRESGNPRGFGFAEMEDSETAIEQLDGRELLGRPVNLKQAEDKPGYKPRQQ